MNRRVLRLNEESSWSPYPVRYRISRISMAGTLNGLEGIRQGRNLKVKPYVTTRFSESRNREPRWNDDYDGGVGSEVRSDTVAHAGRHIQHRLCAGRGRTSSR